MAFFFNRTQIQSWPKHKKPEEEDEDNTEWEWALVTRGSKQWISPAKPAKVYWTSYSFGDKSARRGPSREVEKDKEVEPYPPFNSGCPFRSSTEGPCGFPEASKQERSRMFDLPPVLLSFS